MLEVASNTAGTELARYAPGSELAILSLGFELAFPQHDPADDVLRCMFCARLSSEQPAPCLWETHTGHSKGLWVDSTCTTNMVPDTSLILHWSHSHWQEEGRRAAYLQEGPCVWKVEILHNTDCILHTTPCKLRTAHFTLFTKLPRLVKN